MMITRRQAAMGLVACAALPGVARAEMRCSAINQWTGIQNCSVGLPTPEIIGRQASTIQEKQNWCWAACISGIFAWHGHPVRQDRIVAKIYGDERDQPATGEQIFNAVSGEWTDEYGRRFTGRANPLLDANYSFKDPNVAAGLSIELRDNYPFIIGTRGHATMVTRIDWVNTPYGQEITNVMVRDPWPDNPRLRSLSAQEFAAAFLVMQVRAG